MKYEDVFKSLLYQAEAHRKLHLSIWFCTVDTCQSFIEAIRPLISEESEIVKAAGYTNILQSISPPNSATIRFFPSYNIPHYQMCCAHSAVYLEYPFPEAHYHEACCRLVTGGFKSHFPVVFSNLTVEDADP